MRQSAQCSRRGLLRVMVILAGTLFIYQGQEIEVIDALNELRIEEYEDIKVLK